MVAIMSQWTRHEQQVSPMPQEVMNSHMMMGIMKKCMLPISGGRKIRKRCSKNEHKDTYIPRHQVEEKKQSMKLEGYRQRHFVDDEMLDVDEQDTIIETIPIDVSEGMFRSGIFTKDTKVKVLKL